MNWIENIFCKSVSERLNKTLEQLSDENEKLASALNTLKNTFNEEVQFYEARIKTLNDLVQKSVTGVPDLKDMVNAGTLMTPHGIMTGTYAISKYSQADAFYLSLPLDKWKEVLTRLHSAFKATWTEEIFDCDDFALLSSGLLAYACYKAGLAKQLAYGIAWSPTHAYNIFVTSDQKVYVWEPQSNTIIGELGKTQNPYLTNEAWLMG